jgi:hypothetical protein
LLRGVQPAMASHLASMKVENEQALHRIAFLESNLQIQIQQTHTATERKAELSALRSSALLLFAKQHAEEEAARRELNECARIISNPGFALRDPSY